MVKDKSKIEIDGSLEKWLICQLDAHRDFFNSRNYLLDVGAYHGDFSALGLEKSGCLRHAILFEPNAKNFKFLQQRFANDTNVRLEPFACDVEPGERKFFCQGETYTGSLLNYETATNAPMQETVVQCVVLDDYLTQKNLLGQVGLLKIDTQGNDLRVLRSAEKLLRSGRPWIVCEQIYLPLYESQARAHDIAAFLAQHDYTLAAHFNEYYSSTGWLAWADACYVPREIIGAVLENFESRPTGESGRNSRKTVGQKIRREIQRIFRHGRD